jgi:monoamine oxidase
MPLIALPLFFALVMTMNTNTNQEMSKKKVIVVGAGFSGLSVAYHLRNSAFDVEIIEARDRVGGRVYPYDLDGDGTMVDLGGQWVHEASPKNPIRRLMDELLDVPFVVRSTREEEKGLERRTNVVFDSENGKELNGDVVKAAKNLLDKSLEDYELDDVTIRTSLKDLVDQTVEASLCDRDCLCCPPRMVAVNSDEFQQALNFFIHQNECYEGGRHQEISARLADLYEDKGGPDKIPAGTYRHLLQAVTEKIGYEKIRLGCAVKSIQYDPNNGKAEGKVTVCLQDNEEESIVGDYCVCTVPLGVLQKRKISFVPDLPVIRWKALDAIGMGLLDKIVLKFDLVFWGDLKLFGVGSVDMKKVKSFYDCSGDVGGAPVLMLFLGGDAARRVDSPNGLDDEDAVADAMQALRCIFGADVPEPVASKVTRWNEDSRSFGAYSFTKIGCKEQDYDEVRMPIGNLLFAGEHTSKHSHSTVHGAWETGQREAKRLSARLASWTDT